MSLVKSNGVRTLPKMVSDFFDSTDFFSFPDVNKYFNNRLPAVNIRENESQYTVELAAPGMKKEDFLIAVDGDLLTIRGEEKHESKETTNNYTRQEFNFSSFTRSLTLPENTIAENITAVYEDGLLKLGIPKDLKKPAEEPTDNAREIPVS